METDGHTSHFAASPYQISLILQVQNHFPRKHRAVAAARARGSTHPMLVPAWRHYSCTAHHISSPPCCGHTGTSFHPTVPPARNQLSSPSSAITLQKVEFFSPDPEKHCKKQLKLTEFRACTLILKHWIECSSCAGQEWGAFCVCPSDAQLILTTVPTWRPGILCMAIKYELLIYMVLRLRACTREPAATLGQNSSSTACWAAAWECILY